MDERLKLILSTTERVGIEMLFIFTHNLQTGGIIIHSDQEEQN